MRDRREEVLAQLLVIAQAIPGVTAARNPATMDDLELPAIVFNDGDETRDDSTPPGRGRDARETVVKVTMAPEFIIRVQASTDPGPAMNELLRQLRLAVLEDATLAGIVTNGGSVRYLGCSTATSQARALTGEMGVGFGFTYVLRSDELT